MLVNGEEVGLDLRDLPGSAVQHVFDSLVGLVQTVAWSDWNKRLPDLVKALRERGEKKLILSLEINTKAGAASFAALKPIAAQIVGLRLSGTALDTTSLRRLPSMPSLQWIKIGPCAGCGQGVNHLVAYPALRALDISRTGVTDADLAVVPRLRKLRSLALNGTPVTDASLAYVAKATGLRRLALEATKVTNDGLKFIVKLKNLEQLAISRTKINAAGLEFLASLPKLRRLRLRRLVLSDADLKPLARLSNLRELDLSGSRMTASSVKGLASFRGLVSVSLADNEIGDAGVASLRGCERLEALNLSNSGLSGKSLALLSRMTNLRVLDLSNNRLKKGNPAVLGTLRRLTLLGLAFTDLGRAALPHLRRLSELRGLALDREAEPEDAKVLSRIEGLRWLGLSYSTLRRGDVDRLLRLPKLRRLDAWRVNCLQVGNDVCQELLPRPLLNLTVPLHALQSPRPDSRMSDLIWPPSVPMWRKHAKTFKAAAASLLSCPPERVVKERTYLLCKNKDPKNVDELVMVARGAAGSFLRPGQTEQLVLKDEYSFHSHADGRMYGVVMRWIGHAWEQVKRFRIDSSDGARVITTLRRVDGRDLVLVCSYWMNGGYSRGTCRELDARWPDRSRWQVETFDDRESAAGGGFCGVAGATVVNLNWGAGRGVRLHFRSGELKYRDPRELKQPYLTNLKRQTTRLLFDGWHTSLIDTPPCETDPLRPGGS